MSDLRTALKLDMTKLQQQPYQYNVMYSISHLVNNFFSSSCVIVSESSKEKSSKF